jgi:DNA polymerase V
MSHPGRSLLRATMVTELQPLVEAVSEFASRAAVMGLQRIYKPGFELVKVGVMLLDLIPDTQVQSALIFEELGVGVPSDGRERLMSAMELLNERFGRSKVHVASTGLVRGSKQ